MENKLEDICVYKINVMKSKLVHTEKALYCKYNCNGYEFECEFYKSVKIAQIPISQGSNAYMLMKND